MKITTNNVLKNYTELRPLAKENHASGASTDIGHNFDAVTIQSDPRKLEEHTFAKAVRQEISSDITRTAADEKLKELKRQIASNTYHVDPHAIAARMLLIGEGA